ncbi:MAG TPA: tripartite tricarboxylate transporter substrate-binding protein [Xanthobacteraceae bacterium]|jgi:tripartite-type tricarboxylate transporter receptor subunit TctC
MRTLLASLALIALAAHSVGAQAQDYPARAVTIVVPFAAGGPADITGRIVAEELSRAFGQQFVVENVAGAGGTTGTTRAARASPDGYTLALGHTGTHAAAGAFYPNLAYKPDLDFEPIGLIAEQPELLAVRKDLPPRTLQEFVAYAKANESKLNMAHAGVGSVSYVGCLLLNSAIGIKPTMVPFTGTGPAMNALIAGQVDYVCDPILGPLPHVRAGTVKALAIAAGKRSPLLPDVPTAAEGGLPQFDAAPFYALFAPRGTPQPIVARLAEALNKGLDADVARKRLTELGAEIAPPDRRGPQPLRALVKSEIARLTPVIQAASAK